MPNLDDRLSIFKTITRNKPKLGEDVDLKELASDERCRGFSGADIASLVREASTSALHEFFETDNSNNLDLVEKLLVCKRHFEIAFNKVQPSVSSQDELLYKNLQKKLRIQKPKKKEDTNQQDNNN